MFEGLRTRTLYVVATVGLGFVALRPVPAVERALDVAVVPARWLGELAAPLSWLRDLEVRAAVARVRERTREEIAASRALLEVERAWALPTDPALLAGRAWLHAEVVARGAGDLDRIVIRLPELAGGATPVVPGLPVVSGDGYVGRIVAVDDPLPGQAQVELVTGDDVFVGARLVTPGELADGRAGAARGQRDGRPGGALDQRDGRAGAALDQCGGRAGGALDQRGGRGGDAPVGGIGEWSVRERAGLVRFVVGGLAPTTARDDRDVYLAVHNPSRRDPTPAPVVVHEPATTADPLAALAEGFRLGDLQVVQGEAATVLRVVPRLDYREGLYQVLVLLPPERAPAEPGHFTDAFDDRRWVPARVLLDGDPAFWRRGRKVTAGTRDGVEAGAALALGARFVGRVRRAGLLSSDVALMGDPGLRVPALALVDGIERPIVLGHLVSLGLAERGSGERDASFDGAERNASFDSDGRDASVDDAGERDGGEGRASGAAPAVRFRWASELDLPPEVLALSRERGADRVPATVYTGSGERGVPRGLLVGRCGLPVARGVHELVVATDDAVDAPGLVLVRRVESARERTGSAP